ncbi:MAG TPA: peptidylprolyl isomerase [Candidatus Competibacter sp.]|nr:peptidylprolyl isomerase [Candidatus Competibacter sp.]
MPITVNGVEITDATVRAEMQHHPAPSQEVAEYSAKLALVAKELLLQEATRLKIAGVDDDARIATLIEREVPVSSPSEDDCRRFFQSNRQRFRSGDLFEVSHILCAAPPDDAEARIAARTRAESAIMQLGDGGQFAELASRWSDCPSKEVGGSLGQIGSGQTVPEFERALFAMREGEISGQPVESRYGFHVIWLSRKVEGRALEYEMVRDHIAEHLRESLQRRAVGRYLSGLMSRATIEGIDLVGPASLPAQ